MRTQHKAGRTVILLIALMARTQCGLAWDQPTHRRINHEAIEVLRKTFTREEKYKMAPVDLTRSYRGMGVGASAKWVKDFVAVERTLSGHAWIVYGGDWADEPHIYSGLRHFYDPLAVSNVHYLTDQWMLHGLLYERPQMDAVTWALTAKDNPFNLKRALEYYAHAMQIPEDGQRPGPVVLTNSFKSIPLHPVSRAEERDIYVALALRGLGEVMHMMADMSQPAHVRNDAHPRSEPLEDNISAADVAEFAAQIQVDPRIGAYIESVSGRVMRNPRNLFHQVAVYTNRYFYSSDTVHDKESRVSPWNRQAPYPNPQFKDLAAENVGYALFPLMRYSGAFMEREVPLIRESVFSRSIDGAARLTMGTHFVPAAYAKEQGRVLVPVAIHACTDLLHQFFPTLELTARYKDEGSSVIELERDQHYQRRILSVESKLLHHQRRDPVWRWANLRIDYSGPARMIIEHQGQIRQEHALTYAHADLEGYKDMRGDFSTSPVKLFINESDPRWMPEDEQFFEVFDGDIIRIEVEEGARMMISPKLYISYGGDEMRADFTDRGLRREKDNPNAGVREIAVESRVLGRRFKPQPDDGEVMYLPFSGSAELVFEHEGRVIKVIPVRYTDNQISHIMDVDGKWVRAPLVVYADETVDSELSDLEKRYLIGDTQTVYLRARVGNKRIETGRYRYVLHSDEIDGTYHGHFVVEDDSKIRDLIVGTFSRWIAPLVRSIERSFDKEPSDDASIRATVDSATTSTALGRQIPMALIVEAESRDRVQVNIFIVDDDGETVEMSSRGTYRGGVLSFKARHTDGSVMLMSGRLVDRNRLEGDFSVTAWMMVEDAITGTWEVIRDPE